MELFSIRIQRTFQLVSTPIGIAAAVSEELGGVIVGFTGILRPVVEHPFLPAPGTFPDDHRTGRGLGKAQHARYYV